MKEYNQNNRIYSALYDLKNSKRCVFLFEKCLRLTFYTHFDAKKVTIFVVKLFRAMPI